MASACGKTEAPAPSAQPAEKPAGTQGQWLDADGPGETGLVFRLQAQTIDFTISCRQEDKTFAVSAADPSPRGSSPPMPGDALGVLLGAQMFPAKVVDEAGLAGPGRVAARFRVSPPALRALGEAGALRIVYRDAFTETGQDDTGKLAAFAQACATLTGVAVAP